MKITIPDISKQIYKEDVLNCLSEEYASLGPTWTSSQMQWVNGIYSAFKDHEKFLIVIYLIKKTLDFYSRNFTKITYEDFYQRDAIEIEKFSLVEITEKLSIPKESARRKVIELEKAMIIKRSKKKILVDRSSFTDIRPAESITRISRFLSSLSKIMVNRKILSNKIDSETLEKTIKDNFSYVWKLYYEMQIPTLLSYRELFGDLESWHIFGVCMVNQHLDLQKINSNKKERIEFINSLDSKMVKGINAMSISDISNIPRATVVRKLQKMVKQNKLTIDAKKHYKACNKFTRKLIPYQSNTFDHLAKFATSIYNISILGKKEDTYEVPFYLKEF